MKSSDLHGVTVATVLPFDGTGAIDWRSFERLLAYCAVPDATAAVFVNGHAGEGAALEPAERVAVIRCARKMIGSAKPLLSGVIAGGIPEAVRQARDAEEAGADGIVVFPPEAVGGGAAATPDGPLAWFEALTEAVSIPASVFQYPLASGLGYSSDTLRALARLPKVIAVKDGSGTMLAYEENFRALRAAAPDVAMLASNFHWFQAQLAVGADGILSGLASLAPRELQALWLAAEAEDLAAMRAASDRLYPVVRAVYGPAPIINMHSRIKAGLQALGILADAMPRRPLMPLGAAEAMQVADSVRRSLNVPPQRQVDTPISS